MTYDIKFKIVNDNKNTFQKYYLVNLIVHYDNIYSFINEVLKIIFKYSYIKLKNNEKFS